MSKQLVYAWDFHRNFLLSCIVMVSVVIGYFIGSMSAAPSAHGFLGYDTRGTAHFAQRDYITLGFENGKSDPVYFAMTQGTVIHNKEGVGILEVDPRSGVCVSEVYMVGGVKHRMDGPANIGRNATTGLVEYADWWRLGKPYTPSNDEVRAWNAIEFGSKCDPGKLLGGRWK